MTTSHMRVLLQYSAGKQTSLRQAHAPARECHPCARAPLAGGTWRPHAAAPSPAHDLHATPGPPPAALPRQAAPATSSSRAWAFFPDGPEPVGGAPRAAATPRGGWGSPLLAAPAADAATAALARALSSIRRARGGHA